MCCDPLGNCLTSQRKTKTTVNQQTMQVILKYCHIFWLFWGIYLLVYMSQTLMEPSSGFRWVWSGACPVYGLLPVWPKLLTHTPVRELVVLYLYLGFHLPIKLQEEKKNKVFEGVYLHVYIFISKYFKPH